MAKPDDDLDDTAAAAAAASLPAQLARRLADEPAAGSADTDVGRLSWAPDALEHAPRASAEAERFEPLALEPGAVAAIEVARGTRAESRGWLPELLGVEPRRVPCLFVELRTHGGEVLRLSAPAEPALLAGLPERAFDDAARLATSDALLGALGCAARLGAEPRPAPHDPDAPAALDLAALDPHGVGEVRPPDWPEHPRELLTRGLAVKWADFLVYQVEKVVVVYMLAMMSVAMFLDMFYLSLVRTNESNLARFMMGWYTRFSGAELAPESAASFTATVILLELLAFGGLCYAATATRLKDAPLLTKLATAVWVLVACLAFADIVRHQPAPVAYHVLLGVTVVGSGALWFFSPRETAAQRAVRASRLWVFAAVLLAAPLLASFFAAFPDNFSFAQRQSLFWLLWVGFIGASMATYQRAHLGIDFVRKIVRAERAKRLYNVASLLVTLAFTASFLYVAWDYIFHPQTGAYYKQTPEGEIPDWQKVGIIPLALAVMCARFALQAAEDLILGLRPARPAPVTPNTPSSGGSQPQQA